MIHRILLSLASLVLLSSCGYDYGRETVHLKAGESYRGRTLKKVDQGGISLSRKIDGKTYTSYFKKVNPERGDGSYSLGNNQHLDIHSLDPKTQSAMLEFSWLESVGILTMPPF